LGRLKALDLKDPPPYGDFGPEMVRFATYTQIFFSMLDTVELCQFVWGPSWTLYGPGETVELVKAVTGWNVSLFELMKVGERRLNLLRAFNAREGFSRKDDKLPKKFFKPLVGTGPTAGAAVDRDQFEAALDMYYAMLGWTANGIPTRAKLADLGISWVEVQLPARE
jgi:aldehyde:ferredoxin oxidoreductase